MYFLVKYEKTQEQPKLLKPRKNPRLSEKEPRTQD